LAEDGADAAARRIRLREAGKLRRLRGAEFHYFQGRRETDNYVEPIGYTWTANADGTYNYGIFVDFLVKQSDGKVLGGQEKLLKFAKRSRVRNQELMLVLTLSLGAVEPGEYLVEYTLHDDQSKKESKFTQNFTIQ